MQLNHLDLQVPDVQALATFLEQHFDLVRRSNDRSPAIAILADDAGFSLVIQRRTDEAPYPEGFHIGFIQTTAVAVREHHARLVAAGVDTGPVDVNARGTRFYLKVPGELLVEVSSPERS
ncbi:MAG: VOC family protein [Kofleriaceae bacterium]